MYTKFERSVLKACTCELSTEDSKKMFEKLFSILY